MIWGASGIPVGHLSYLTLLKSIQKVIMKQFKLLFNDCNKGEKKRFYRNEFENQGIFNRLFPEEDFVEFSSEENSQRLQT